LAGQNEKQGAGEAVRQGGAAKKLRAMETYKKTKNIVTSCASFCSVTILTSKIITEMIENHSELSGWANNCNRFVSRKTLIYHEISYDTVTKRHLRSRFATFVRAGAAMPLSCPSFPASLV